MRNQFNGRTTRFDNNEKVVKMDDDIFTVTDISTFEYCHLEKYCELKESNLKTGLDKEKIKEMINKGNKKTLKQHDIREKNKSKNKRMDPKRRGTLEHDKFGREVRSLEVKKEVSFLLAALSLAILVFLTLLLWFM